MELLNYCVQKSVKNYVTRNNYNFNRSQHAVFYELLLIASVVGVGIFHKGQRVSINEGSKEESDVTRRLHRTVYGYFTTMMIKSMQGIDRYNSPILRFCKV